MFVCLSVHPYRVCLLNSQRTSIKIEQLKIEPCLFLAFSSIEPGDVDVFFAALSLPSEGLGNVCCHGHFHIPSSYFWEASWLRLRPASSLFAPSWPINSENVVQDGKKPRRSSLWSPATFWIAPSSSPRKAVWSFSWLTSWKQQIVMRSVMNLLSQHNGPEQVSWHSLDDHSPLQRQSRRWTLSQCDFSDLPPTLPFLLFHLLIIAYSCVLVKALSW